MTDTKWKIGAKYTYHGVLYECTGVTTTGGIVVRFPPTGVESVLHNTENFKEVREPRRKTLFIFEATGKGSYVEGFIWLSTESGVDKNCWKQIDKIEWVEKI